MQSLTFTPGRAFLASESNAVPWTVVFEDEGVSGYFYACDRSHEKLEDSILDAMLIYSVAAVEKGADGGAAERIVSIDWSNFPNFLADQGDVWNRSSHAWSDAAFEQFEAALYA